MTSEISGRKNSQGDIAWMGRMDSGHSDCKARQAGQQCSYAGDGLCILAHCFSHYFLSCSWLHCPASR